jgi:hypothetical protein
MPLLGIIASQGRVLPNSYESISTVTVGSGGASNIEFTSIPSTFTHLQIRFNGFYSGSGSSLMQINSDTGSNYSYHYLGRAGSNTVVAGSGATQSNIFLGNTPQTQPSYPLSHIIDILDYKNTNKYKTIRLLSGADTNGNGASWVGLLSGSWQNTNAITSIKLYPSTGNLNQYTKATLYGIKGV